MRDAQNLPQIRPAFGLRQSATDPMAGSAVPHEYWDGTTHWRVAADGTKTPSTGAGAGGGASWAPARLLTAAAMPAGTYAAATQTRTASANGALSVDGVAAAVGDRIWDKDHVTGSQRGLWRVEDAGSAGTPWKIKRAADASASSDYVDGKLIAIGEGSQAGTSWRLTNDAPFTLDTSVPVIAREVGVVLSTRAVTVTAPITGGGDLSADRVVGISAATTAAAGSMSAADKLKSDSTVSAVQSLSGAGAASLTARTTRHTTTGVGSVVTLANGTYDGQRKSFVIGVFTATHTIVVTPAAATGFATATLDALHDAVELEWSATLAAWFIVSNVGATIA